MRDRYNRNIISFPPRTAVRTHTHTYTHTKGGGAESVWAGDTGGQRETHTDTQTNRDR